jgi:hypothetical protein
MLDLAKRGFEGGTPRIEHDIPFGIELGTLQPESLAKTALDAVADNGSSDRTRNGEPKARTRVGVRYAPSGFDAR